MSMEERTAGAAAVKLATVGLSMEELEHELRTPLTSIRLMLEIMRDCPDLCEEQRHCFLEALLVDEARLARTVENLLESPTFAGLAR